MVGVEGYVLLVLKLNKETVAGEHNKAWLTVLQSALPEVSLTSQEHLKTISCHTVSALYL